MTLIYRTVLVATCLLAGFGCAAKPAVPLPVTSVPVFRTRTIPVALTSGTTTVDVYEPASAGGARPLVVVTHGFARGKANMAGWGRALAEAGYVAAVPDLPAWSDHARNGRFVNELVDHLIASPLVEGVRVDRERAGLVGFSAGGLATLLAAADNPRIRVWVGLDPVDRDGLGAAAAARLHCRAAVLRAEPSSCNAHGNAAAIEQALPAAALRLRVPDATHADPEWPTDWKAELMCGKANDERRAVFVRHALGVLRAAFPPPTR